MVTNQWEELVKYRMSILKSNSEKS
jgi:hypothetical protein